MSAAFKCDQCGRFQNGVPFYSVKVGDLQVSLLPEANRITSIRLIGPSGSQAIDTTYHNPKILDLCPTCLPKKIIAICNEALAAKTKK